jgi:hypothetical protein
MNTITDEVISELDVITCNIDERMHDPPSKKSISRISQHKERK